MISLCCFSKNRPMQLWAFLESVKKNAPYIDDVWVLYTYEGSNFEHGYNEVQDHFKDCIFIKEKEGRDWWKNCIINLLTSFDEYFCWATDDSLFYRRAWLTKERLDWAFKYAGARSLNLRVGENIIWQNHWFAERTPKIEITETLLDEGGGGSDDIIIWDAEPLGVQNDFGRVWQNDASVMPRDLYLEYLEKEDHWYKGKGCRGLDNVAGSGGALSPRMAAAFRRSTYVNIPVNLVHLLDDGRLYADNYARFIKQDINDLQYKFDNGLRIDWETIDFSGLNCGRKELEYVFRHE